MDCASLSLEILSIDKFQCPLKREVFLGCGGAVCLSWTLVVSVGSEAVKLPGSVWAQLELSGALCAAKESLPLFFLAQFLFKNFIIIIYCLFTCTCVYACICACVGASRDAPRLGASLGAGAA